MKIIDFDGTLVDVWPRYYAVFSELTKSNVGLERYRQVKRICEKDSIVAQNLGVELPDDYFENKRILLEEKEFLELDKLWIDVEEILSFFRKEDIILTKRRRKDNFFWELDRLGLYDLISQSHVIQSSKEEYVRKYYCEYEKIVLGDSTQDLEMGRVPRTRCIMLGCGLFAPARFEQTNMKYDYYNTLSEAIRSEHLT